jgi:hypothetical protein
MNFRSPLLGEEIQKAPSLQKVYELRINELMNLAEIYDAVRTIYEKGQIGSDLWDEILLFGTSTPSTILQQLAEYGAAEDAK